MQYLSLQPFIPSGANFAASKKLFLALSFNVSWDAGDYLGFEKDECRFILQNLDNKEFAGNFMITVRVSDVNEFYRMVLKKGFLKNSAFESWHQKTCLMVRNVTLSTLQECAGILWNRQLTFVISNSAPAHNFELNILWFLTLANRRPWCKKHRYSGNAVCL
jgi:hypothetical protein